MIGKRFSAKIGSHDTIVVDANKCLWKYFALFKDQAFASTTGVWCLLIHATATSICLSTSSRRFSMM
jgi:hypothetical protein